MYTLYYKAGACSLAVHVLLRELDLAFELEPSKDASGDISPKLARIHPRGSVPVLQDSGFVLKEGGAILSWLCDEYDSPLLPRAGESRATALQWLMFANATLHPAYGQVFMIDAQAIDQSSKNALLNVISAKIQRLWDEVETQLEQGDYICGEAMSVADILLSVIANWAPMMPIEISYGPRCKAMFKRVSARPAYQAALEAESIEYQAAA